MVKSRDSLVWGIILLLVGLLFLLWNFGVFAAFEGTAELVIAGLFGLAGLGFLVSYLLAREDWWKVIPGFALLAVGSIVFLSTRVVDPVWIGAVLFLGIALAFAVIYLSDRQERWWALIPFGVMVVMVAIVLISTLGWAEEAIGSVLFGGMGLVFLLVYLLAHDRREFRWALIPMSVLMVMALVSLAAFVVTALPNLEQIVRLWPLLLVIVGVFLVGLSISRAPLPASEVTVLPAQPKAVEATPAAPGTAIYEIPEELPSDEGALAVGVDELPVVGQPWTTEDEEVAAQLAEREHARAEEAAGEELAAAVVDPTEKAGVAGMEEAVESEVETNVAGEVEDIYEFLKGAPPESGSEEESPGQV